MPTEKNKKKVDSTLSKKVGYAMKRAKKAKRGEIDNDSIFKSGTKHIYKQSHQKKKASEKRKEVLRQRYNTNMRATGRKDLVVKNKK